MKKKLQNILAGAALLALGTTAVSAAKTVKIAYPNWAEGIAMTYLVKAVLEEEMGYDVELTQADPGAIYAALADKNQDLFLDAWLPNTHAPYWEKFGDKLVDMGPAFGYGVTGLVVPSYVTIDSIEDLPKIRKDLAGRIVGIGTGAGIYRNTNKVIDEYGLDFQQVASSGPAMTAALKEAIDSKKPIVVTGWKPHWKFGRYDLKVLRDPRGIYPIDQLKKVARQGFAKDFPDVAQFVTNFNMTEDTLLSLMLAIDDAKGQSTAAVARDWMIRNEPLISSWMPLSN
jgi:glycine betaine/proline transport system substrate-binding protein